MVDSGRATDPPASLFTFFTLSRFADSSVPYCRAGAGVAPHLLLDMSCSAASSVRRKTAGWSTASRLADCFSGICLWGFLVSRKLLLDLFNDAPLRQPLGSRLRWSSVSVCT